MTFSPLISLLTMGVQVVCTDDRMMIITWFAWASGGM